MTIFGMRISANRYGFQVGRFRVCWWDAWQKRILLEVSWERDRAPWVVLLRWRW